MIGAFCVYAVTVHEHELLKCYLKLSKRTTAVRALRNVPVVGMNLTSVHEGLVYSAIYRLNKYIHSFIDLWLFQDALIVKTVFEISTYCAIMISTKLALNL